MTSSVQTSYAIHDIHVCVRGKPDWATQAVADLLSAYRVPAAPGRTPDVIFELQRAASSTPPRRAGDAPLFVYEPMWATADGDTIRLSDGHSQLWVHARGRRIDACVHEQSARDIHQFGALLCGVALQICLRHHGLYYTHAAALISDSGRTVLLTGNSGEGKSTLSMALALAGWRFVSDDAVYLRRGSDRLLAFRRPVHLDGSTLALLPELRRLARGPHRRAGRIRWDLDPAEAFGNDTLHDIASGAALLVVLNTGASAAQTGVQPLTSQQALPHLLRQGGLVMLGGPPAQNHLDALTRLAREGPNLQLTLGPGLLGRPRKAASALRQAEVALAGSP